MGRMQNFLKEIGEIFKGKDDYMLDTYEDVDSKIKGKAYMKIGKWVIIIPTILISGVILFKAVPAIIELKMKEASVDSSKKEKKNTEIAFSEDEMWKLQSEEKQKKLETELVSLKSNVDDVKTIIESSVLQINENITKNNKSNQETIKAIKKELSHKIEKSNNKLEKVKNEKDIALEELKKELNSGKYSKETSLTKLDPSKLMLLNPEKPNFKNQNEANSRVNKIMDKAENYESVNQVVEEYEYVEIAVTEGREINTLSTEEDEEDSNKKIQEFYLSGGFVKGTLLTGGDFHTMSEGDEERIPVTISIDSKLRSSNNEDYDLRDCFLNGPGKADFTSKTALIKITNIQCNLTDEEGKKYAINEKIEGWVYDENGQYGAKGRLITRDGEIISKALPLAFLQTGLEVLSNRSQNTSSEGVVSFSGASVGANAGQSIMDKIGDKWLKYIDGLNPKVNIRPGRQVIVQFKGGDKLKINEVEPADLGNFRKAIEDDNYEE